MASWRDSAARVIAQCIADNPNAYESDLRKIISAAYPFGERKYHPYKIWLDEVRRQLHVVAMRKSQKMNVEAFRKRAEENDV